MNFEFLINPTRKRGKSFDVQFSFLGSFFSKASSASADDRFTIDRRSFSATFPFDAVLVFLDGVCE